MASEEARAYNGVWGQRPSELYCLR